LRLVPPSKHISLVEGSSRQTPSSSPQYQQSAVEVSRQVGSELELHTCRKSIIGQRLARFFCSLLINSPLGINSKWIGTNENTIADKISCLKSLFDEHSQPTYDYSNLQQTFPELKHCSFFQPKPELISLIWEMVLHEKWPCHEDVRTLKLSGLGKLIISSGAR
jgi:hypothetical protein